MADIARWKNKKWEVSSQALIPLEGLTIKYQQSADNNKSTEEKQVTNQRGIELIPLTFTTTLIAGAVDVRKEIEEWESLVSKVDYFYLAGRNLGPAMQLRKVEVSDVKLDSAGNMMFAKLSFEFKEYDKETTSVKSDVPALEVTATDEDKKIMWIFEEIKLSDLPVNQMKVGDLVQIIGDYDVADNPIPEEYKDREFVISTFVGSYVRLNSPGLDEKVWVFKKDLSLL